MTDAVALWYEGGGRFTLERETLPEAGPGACIVETLFTALSPGTERLVYTGRIPEPAYQAMRCPYMGGAFPHPVKYGYSLIGRVSDGPAELHGRLVHVLHPHQSRCGVRIDDVYPLPEGIPPRRATLASNLETAVTAVWDSGVGLGDRVLVVGFGAVGSLVARLLSWIPGLELAVTDRAQARRALARRMGFDAPAPEDLDARFDLAIHASGAGAGLQLALDHLAFEGRVVDLSWYGTRAVTLRLGEGFHHARQTIVSSQVSHLPAERRARWSRTRRRALVFTLLERPELDQHIGGAMPFGELPAALPAWLAAPGSDLSRIVEYAPGAG